jgi:beta-galactosidase
VFGLRDTPYVAVQPPEHHGQPLAHVSPWSFDDVEASWSWAGHEGASVSATVYTDADEVELLVNGRSLGRQPAGPDRGFRARFECTYEPGMLEAIAWRADTETGRTVLRSAEGPVLLAAAADRPAINATPSDLAFVELALVDASGEVHSTADRLITVAVDGPAVLQGLGSANPCTDEPFTGPTCTTFRGRALAVVRPIGAGTITVTVTAEGCDEARTCIDAS